jgi:hypothetical protein
VKKEHIIDEIKRAVVPCMSWGLHAARVDGESYHACVRVAELVVSRVGPIE